MKRKLLLALLGVVSFGLTFWFLFTRPQKHHPPSKLYPRSRWE